MFGFTGLPRGYISWKNQYNFDSYAFDNVV